MRNKRLEVTRYNKGAGGGVQCGRGSFRIATPLIHAPSRQETLAADLSPYHERHPQSVVGAWRCKPINSLAELIGLFSNRPTHSGVPTKKAKEAISRTCPPYISLMRNEWDVILLPELVRGGCPPGPSYIDILAIAS